MDETQPLTFELTDAWTEHVTHDGNLTRRPQSFFLDRVIGGATFRAGLPGADTVVTPLNPPWLDGIAESVDILTGGRPEADLTPGRAGTFSCVVCGEVDVSAALTVHADGALVGPALGDSRTGVARGGGPVNDDLRAG